MRKITTWVLAACLLLASPAVQAAGPQSETSEQVNLRNVQLNEKGQLVGQILDSTGRAVARAEVAVHSQSQQRDVATRVRTDATGRFVVEGLKDGVCVLDVAGKSYACRVWNSDIAPPKSLDSVVIVSGDAVVRGQMGPLNRLASLSPGKKALLCGLIATAIVVPIVADDDDDAS